MDAKISNYTPTFERNVVVARQFFFLQKLNRFGHLSNYCVIWQVLPLAPSAFSTPKSPRCSQLAINVNVNWQFNYFQTIVMPIVHHFTQKPNKPQLQDSWHKPQ